MSYDLVIKNGRIITAGEDFVGDVAIAGESIAALGQHLSGSGKLMPVACMSSLARWMDMSICKCRLPILSRRTALSRVRLPPLAVGSPALLILLNRAKDRIWWRPWVAAGGSRWACGH